jgi:ferredoxin
MQLSKERVDAFLAELNQAVRVYVPARGEAVSSFARYGQGTEPAFDLVNTDMPPKDMLFPQTEKMYRYGLDDEGKPFVDATFDADEVVLFGVRPCDMRSIECMDDVFLTRGFIDEYYETRRQKLTTFALACTAPAPTCFCDSMGLNAGQAPAADVLLKDVGAAWQLAAQSEKGAALLEKYKGFFDESDVQDAGAKNSDSVSCTLKVDMDGVKEKLDQMFDHPLWEDITKKCLTCGTCTYVCPTCYCFDISQSNRMKIGERYRCWDSCMFSVYSEMAGGHNPRADKLSRVRQRFMHKLCFFEDRYGKSLCVGCGRCIQKCPVALDISCLIDEIGAAELAPVAPVGEKGAGDGKH